MHAIGGKREQRLFIMRKSDPNRNSSAPRAGFLVETARERIEVKRLNKILSTISGIDPGV
jgi:hypothetical protein